MIKAVFVLLFVVSVSLVTLIHAEPKCGTHKLGFQPRIVNGEVADEHAYPWMAYLLLTFDNSKGGKDVYSCGASLINKQWLLSAAHCFDDQNQSRKFAFGTAVLGINDINNNRRSNHSIKIVFGPNNVFENKNFENMTNDVSLVKLPKPLDIEKVKDYVFPICLPNKDISVNESKCIATGWGKTGVLDQGSEKLLQIHSPIVPLNKCQLTYGLATKDQICSGDDQHTVCNGDSGGPLQCINSNGGMTIQGIVSYGSTFCDQFAVYTRVENYLGWINNIMNQN